MAHSNLTIFQNLPKVDLHNHLHLGGTAVKLRERYPDYHIHIPSSYNGLSGMIDFIYGTLGAIMTTANDVVQFMEIAIEAAVDDNVSVLEASIDVRLIKFFPDGIDGLLEAVERLRSKYENQINFRPDIGINKNIPSLHLNNQAIACIESGLFNGIDLYGEEKDKDLSRFVELYERATQAGLIKKVHIGEFSDHKSIDNVIVLLEPQQLQHGIRAVDSVETMNLIKSQNIQLNLCPQSNIALGAASSLKQHPIRQLFDNGIKITISTDDLLLFDASNSKQFADLLEQRVFSMEELLKINNNALDSVS